VRVFSRQGRDSGWSDFAILRALPPIDRPSRPVAEAVREGVHLTWQVPGAPAGVVYRVLRRSAGQESSSVIGTSGAPEYLDSSAEFGKAYEYAVQAAVKSGQSEAESEISEPVSFTPVDRFPPAVPAGLSVLAGTGTVELVWERNQETDLRGYRIYRAAGDGPMQSTGELIEVPSYSDAKIESGKHYRYAVTAIDQLGNESAPSIAVEITVP
jgi:fibronectin type 3 domain-containing protein